MLQDESTMLTYGLTALQDQSGEISKLDAVKAECAQLTQYVQSVEEDHLAKIAETEKRIKEKTAELERLIQEGQKFRELLAGHTIDFNKSVAEHQESMAKSETVMQDVNMMRKKRNNEKAEQVNAVKSSKKAQKEAEGLLMVSRSILKTYLLPLKDAVLKGVVKDVAREKEFSIDCNSIDQKELHEQVWRIITNYQQ